MHTSNILEIFKAKEFPDFITSHKIFNEVKTLKKIFPSIGLPNCKEESIIKFESKAKLYATELVSDIFYDLGNAKTRLNYNMPARQKGRILNIISILDSLATIKKKTAISKFISENDTGKVSINLACDVVNKKEIIFRKGEGLFKVYNKVYAMINELKRGFHFITKLEDRSSFKNFSAENVPSNNYKIVFSSNGVDGAWDIATMSMRGFRSCQSWDGDFKHCLIGSILDPFVGIIYLSTDAPTKYGKKMMKRCLVRYVINKEERKPYLFVDRMYPSDDIKVRQAFNEFLNKHSCMRIISFPKACVNNKYYIPFDSVNAIICGNECAYKSGIDHFAGQGESAEGYWYEFNSLRSNSIVSYADKNLPHVKVIKIDSNSTILNKYERLANLYPHLNNLIWNVLWEPKSKKQGSILKISNINKIINYVLHYFENNTSPDLLSDYSNNIKVFKTSLINIFGTKISKDSKIAEAKIDQIASQIISLFLVSKKQDIKNSIKLSQKSKPLPLPE